MGQISLKLSEAKLLVLMENIPIRNRYASWMVAKLGLDYQHSLHILNGMIARGWLVFEQGHNKKYYSLTTSAPLSLAKERVLQGVDEHARKEGNKESI